LGCIFGSAGETSVISLMALLVALGIPFDARADLRAVVNPHWQAVHEFQDELFQQSRLLNIPIDPDMAPFYSNLAAEQGRLMVLARQYDTEEESLKVRNRSLVQEFNRVNGSTDDIAVNQYNARHYALVSDYNQFRQREEINYDQPVLDWENHLMAFREIQEREGVRLKTTRPLPRIDAETLPRLMLEPVIMPARLLYNASVEGGKHPEQVGDAAVLTLGAGAAIAGLELPVAAVASIAVVTGGRDWVKAADEEEIARQESDLEKSRRMPLVVRRISEKSLSLEAGVRAGKITKEEKDRQVHDYAVRLVERLPRSKGDPEHRLRDDFLSPRSGWAVGTVIVATGGGYWLSKEAKPLLEEMGPGAAALIGASSTKGVKSTKEIYGFMMGEVLQRAPETLKLTPSEPKSKGGEP